MIGHLYTLGYAAPDAEQQLMTLMADPSTLLVDIRYSPRSRWQPQWNTKTLQAAWGDRYRHMKALGNVNYRFPDAPIQLLDAGAGIQWARETVAKTVNYPMQDTTIHTIVGTQLWAVTIEGKQHQASQDSNRSCPNESGEHGNPSVATATPRLPVYDTGLTCGSVIEQDLAWPDCFICMRYATPRRARLTDAQ